MRCLTSVVIAIFASTAFAAEDKPPPPTADEIRALIDGLVSANPKAITSKEDKSVGSGYRLPEGFAPGKQKDVHAARQRLKKLGPVAFPFLIERWDDKRYCCTKSVGINGFCFNATVGDVCQDIVFDQLQPYGTWPETEDDPRGESQRPGYPSEKLHSGAEARKWYETNKKKTLYEMQLMVIDWVIAEESKKTGDFTDEERAELKGIRAKLIETGKPIDRGNYEGNDIEV